MKRKSELLMKSGPTEGRSPKAEGRSQISVETNAVETQPDIVTQATRYSARMQKKGIIKQKVSTTNKSLMKNRLNQKSAQAKKLIIHKKKRKRLPKLESNETYVLSSDMDDVIEKLKATQIRGKTSVDQYSGYIPVKVENGLTVNEGTSQTMDQKTFRKKGKTLSRHSPLNSEAEQVSPTSKNVSEETPRKRFRSSFERPTVKFENTSNEDDHKIVQSSVIGTFKKPINKTRKTNIVSGYQKSKLLPKVVSKQSVRTKSAIKHGIVKRRGRSLKYNSSAVIEQEGISQPSRSSNRMRKRIESDLPPKNKQTDKNKNVNQKKTKTKMQNSSLDNIKQEINDSTVHMRLSRSAKGIQKNYSNLVDGHIPKETRKRKMHVSSSESLEVLMNNEEVVTENMPETKSRNLRSRLQVAKDIEESVTKEIEDLCSKNSQIDKVEAQLQMMFYGSSSKHTVSVEDKTNKNIFEFVEDDMELRMAPLRVNISPRTRKNVAVAVPQEVIDLEDQPEIKKVDILLQNPIKTKPQAIVKPTMSRDLSPNKTVEEVTKKSIRNKASEEKTPLKEKTSPNTKPTDSTKTKKDKETPQTKRVSPTRKRQAKITDMFNTFVKKESTNNVESASEGQQKNDKVCTVKSEEGSNEEEEDEEEEENMFDDEDDSDSESRAEWMPEDYAEYKYKFSMKKLKKPTVYKCKICLRILPTYYRLKQHKKIHRDKEDPYSCTQCEKTFTSVEELTAHIRVHKGKHPYQCKKCEKGFWNKTAYDEHMPIHILKKTKVRDKRFRCDVCAKEFSKLCDMERHTRVHTGEKPCVCNICNKRFQQSHNLSKHLLTHLHVRPYHCEICNKKFGRNDVLNRHLLVHSVEKPFMCEFCPKGFIRQQQYTHHLKRVHPDETDNVTGRTEETTTPN